MLKKLLLFTLVLITLTSFANDQKKGFRAGSNISWVRFSGASQGKALTTPYFGFYIYEKFTPLVKIGSGLEYLRMGKSEPNFIMHYAEMPLNARAEIGSLHITAGSGFRLKMWERIEQDNGEMDYPESPEAIWYDVPIRLGLGYKILFLGLELRYNIGLVDLNYGKHNHNLQFGAFVEF